MPRLYGADAVKRQQMRIDAVFTLLADLSSPPELQSHHARYLCVLLSGFAEQSVKNLVLAYVRTRSSHQVQRFVELRLNHIWGINSRKLRDVLDAFDASWWHAIETSYAQELDALDS